MSNPVTFGELYCKVAIFFNNDYDKTDEWFLTDNILLGGLSPIEAFYSGRSDRLAQFINTSIDENMR